MSIRISLKEPALPSPVLAGNSKDPQETFLAATQSKQALIKSLQDNLANRGLEHIKVLDILGSGHSGRVFLVEINKQKMALKVPHEGKQGIDPLIKDTNILYLAKNTNAVPKLERAYTLKKDKYEEVKVDPKTGEFSSSINVNLVLMELVEGKPAWKAILDQDITPEHLEVLATNMVGKLGEVTGKYSFAPKDGNPENFFVRQIAGDISTEYEMIAIDGGAIQKTYPYGQPATIEQKTFNIRRIIDCTLGKVQDILDKAAKP